MTLAITLACGDYDRTAALADARVRPEGVELTYLRLPVEETFFRMLTYREFDVAELSLSSYCASLCADDPGFVAIPVFPSRSFRHGSIFVNADSGIEEPSQLRGRVVGTPEYEITAGVWIRGMLADEYGVPVESVSYRTGGLEQPERREKLTLALPDTLDIRPIRPGRALSDALAEGEIDALYTARAPSTFRHGDARVRRLFSDPQATEEAYFSATGIFPIMHVIALRRELHERVPWVARSLLKAFTAARDLAYARLRETAALGCMAPWMPQQTERVCALMGDDFWPYGLEPNRHVLDVFLRYHHEQHLSSRRLQAADLFAPETLEVFAI